MPSLEHLSLQYLFKSCTLKFDMFFKYVFIFKFWAADKDIDAKYFRLGLHF